jgi:hypothetical protein
MSRHWLLVLSCIAFGLLRPIHASVSYPPPSAWKAINYYPRYHSFNAMLWDWNSTDSHTSQTVSTMVSNDLATLKNNGFNVLHLYIWDRQIMMDFSSGDVRGFCSAVSDPGACANSGDQHPEYSPDATGATGKLWDNLNAFLTVADNHDLYVIITFVNGAVRNMLAKSSNCSAIASYYKTWTQRFVDDLEASHDNILTWGFHWDWTADGHYTCSNSAWAEADAHMRARAAAGYPSRPLQATVSSGFTLAPYDPDSGRTTFPSEIIRRDSAYDYNWYGYPNGAQQVAKAMYDSLDAYYNSISDSASAREADYFGIGGYNAHSGDLYSALYNLINTPSPGGRTVPASKIWVAEFGTSSGLSEASGSVELGLPNGWFPYGLVSDEQVPITTRDGQSQWVNNAVCAFQAAGIRKQAYWNMYDPVTYWSSGYQNLGNGLLQMHGYFGLVTEDGSTFKGAWNTLTSYYAGTLSCPSPGSAPPVLEVAPGTSYIVWNQPLRVYWTGTDSTSRSLNRSYVGGSKSCLLPDQATIAASSLDGSCAFTSATAYYASGSETITLTAYNGGAAPVSKNINFTLGSAPIITAITDSNYATHITTSSIITVWAYGLNRDGGNTIQLHNNSSGADW